MIYMIGLKIRICINKAINMVNKVSYKQLKKAYLQAANIVAIHGKKYLPIFERLENECRERKKQVDILNRAIKLANSDKEVNLN